jgi:hypothetical protein
MRKKMSFWFIGVLLVIGFVAAGCGSSPAASTRVDLNEVTSYYVRADGSNLNDGLTEETAFRSLWKAVDAAKNGTIKTITVLGTLNLESEGTNSSYPGAVFIISDTRGTELTIRGGAEQGVLSGGSGRMVMLVLGDARIRLENLRIEGGDSEKSGAGSQITGKAHVTLRSRVLVRNNRSQANGGGVAVGDTGTFMMESGTILL